MAAGKNAEKTLKSSLRRAGAHRALFNHYMQRDMPKGMGIIDALFEDNPLLLGGAAHAMGQLDPRNSEDAAILQAFEIARLNPKNPLHWREVMSVFCVHHFGKQKTKPVKWNDDAILKWYADCEVVKAKNPLIKTDLDLAKYLGRHHPDYKNKFKTAKSFRHMTKRIEDAYNPKKNLRLRYPEMSDVPLMKFRAEQEAKGVVWSAAMEKLFVDARERLKGQIHAMAEQAVTRHPQLASLLNETTERTKSRLAGDPEAKLQDTIERVLSEHPNFQSLVSGAVEQVKSRLEGDLEDTREP